MLFDGLQVFPARMRENLDLSGGLIMAEALMLELGKQIGRQRAHDAVYDAAQASATQSRPFRDTLAEDPHVSAGLSAGAGGRAAGSRPLHGPLPGVRGARAAAGREIAAAISSRAAGRKVSGS